MLWGEPLAQAAETISAVREQARSNSREVEFSLSFRPILGRTEDEAWAKAEAIRAAPARAWARPASQGQAAERRRPASAQGGGAGRAPRRAPLDRNRQAGRWRAQLHRPGRYRGTGGRRAARLLRPGRAQYPHSRFRSPRRCRGIRPRADPADPRQSRRARAPARHGLIPWPSCRLPRRRSTNGCRN
ncbi:LLM class flavin-dependent oxidoreductase [Pseudomonas aeruginosa]|nr:LLM class flavin-dependent oxidoreductase [Pseudomonas aeruginosa]